MTGLDSLILLISCILVMVLVVFNACQWLLARRELDPLEAKTTERNVFVLSSILFIVVFVAHLVTSFMTGNGVGTDNFLLIVFGVLAVVLAILATLAFLAKNKLWYSAEIIYYSCMILMWIFVIAHIWVRATI